MIKSHDATLISVIDDSDALALPGTFVRHNLYPLSIGLMIGRRSSDDMFTLVDVMWVHLASFSTIVDVTPKSRRLSIKWSIRF